MLIHPATGWPMGTLQLCVIMDLLRILFTLMHTLPMVLIRTEPQPDRVAYVDPARPGDLERIIMLMVQQGLIGGLAQHSGNTLDAQVLTNANKLSAAVDMQIGHASTPLVVRHAFHQIASVFSSVLGMRDTVGTQTIVTHMRRTGLLPPDSQSLVSALQPSVVRPAEAQARIIRSAIPIVLQPIFAAATDHFWPSGVGAALGL